MDAAIRQIRSFNRLVVERIGALDDRFLRRRRPMSESRLLWEIGPDGMEVRTLRAHLNLDSGYLSRVLRSLERQKLIVVRATRDDGRVRRVCLTQAGRKERVELDRRSDALAAGILEVLSDRQREALTSAMGEVERLLRASMITLTIEDPATADARWCFEQYYAELNARFEGGFDPGRSLLPDARALAPPKGLVVVARLRARPVGCGALKFHGRSPAELKRLWVSPDARGIGVARRLMTDLERRAAHAGVKLLRLDTNRALSEAIALYRRSGYIEVPAFNNEPYAHHWFEKRLT